MRRFRFTNGSLFEMARMGRAAGRPNDAVISYFIYQYIVFLPACDCGAMVIYSKVTVEYIEGAGRTRITITWKVR